MLETLREMSAFRALILEMARRDLKLRYKNSVGGILWSLLNPLMQVAAITLVMKFLKPNPVGDYSAYLLGPLFLWNFIQAALFDGSVSILANARLVRKVYFPRGILPLSTLLGNLFHFSISFVFTLLFLLLYTGSYPSLLRWEFLLVIPIIALTFCFCLGCNFVLSYLNVFYEDVRFMVQALSSIFFYVLPLLYTVEDVRHKLGAESWAFKLYMANPVAALMVCYQRALLPPPLVTDSKGDRIPPLDWPALWPHLGWATFCSLGALVLGFALFNRHQWQIAEQL
jgi:ABC-type polysaccharide/polyol phosphate export permease